MTPLRALEVLLFSMPLLMVGLAFADPEGPLQIEVAFVCLYGATAAWVARAARFRDGVLRVAGVVGVLSAVVVGAMWWIGEGLAPGEASEGSWAVFAAFAMATGLLFGAGFVLISGGAAWAYVRAGRSGALRLLYAAAALTPVALTAVFAALAGALPAVLVAAVVAVWLVAALRAAREAHERGSAPASVGVQAAA